jgi:2-phospho-L-lactate/phosphoenolpyruvate guanylyltransferase
VTAERDIWAVVPVKGLAQAKTRLAPQLSPAARSELACAMLEDVLAALAEVRTLAGIVVATVDPVAIGIACRHGASVSGDDATRGHTAAVMAAARRLHQIGRRGMLTVPADIPGVRAYEVEALLAQHGDAPAFTIVPAHDGRGSNAVVVSPPAAVSLAFGNDSFRPHLAAARQVGIEPVIVTGLPGIGLDIDRYEDALALLRTGGGVHSRAVLGATANATS